MEELRPLGDVTTAIEQLGFKITYAYDDLLFIEHSPFLLRFDADDVKTLHFYAHKDLDDNQRLELYHAVAPALQNVKLSVIESGTFSLDENKDKENNLDVLFFDKKSSS